MILYVKENSTKIRKELLELMENNFSIDWTAAALAKTEIFKVYLVILSPDNIL